MVFTAYAVEVLNEILDKMEKSSKKDKKALKSLRTRARNTPSMIMTTGLPQTLAFLASKADEDYYKYLAMNAKKPDKEKEEAGYAAYLYAIMKFLSEKINVISKTPSNLREVIEVIKKVDEEPNLSAAIQNLLTEYLLEFKKLAEALIEEE